MSELKLRKKITRIYRFSLIPGLSIYKDVEEIEFKDEDSEWKPLPEIIKFIDL